MRLSEKMKRALRGVRISYSLKYSLKERDQNRQDTWRMQAIRVLGEYTWFSADVRNKEESGWKGKSCLGKWIRL